MRTRFDSATHQAGPCRAMLCLLAVSVLLGPAARACEEPVDEAWLTIMPPDNGTITVSWNGGQDSQVFTEAQQYPETLIFDIDTQVTLTATAVPPDGDPNYKFLIWPIPFSIPPIP